MGDVHGLYAELTGLAGMWTEPDARASAALEEALLLERPEWPARERAWGQRARADVAKAQGRLPESKAAREAELMLREQAGDERGRLRAMLHIADLALLLGHVDEAVEHARALLKLVRAQRSPPTLKSSLALLVRALKRRGDSAEAEMLEKEMVG